MINIYPSTEWSYPASSQRRVWEEAQNYSHVLDWHRPVCGRRAPAVISLIGKTPLAELARVTRDVPRRVTVLVKLEGMNPGGSVKDRTALYIVQEALRTGKLTPGRILIDATSGNTGIAYAMLGAALGFPVKLAMAANASPERLRILQAYGASVILTDPVARTDGARQVVRELVAASPELYFHADQYSNPANPLAHYMTTGPEIWQQSGGRITHFVAGMGTSGTMMGAGRYLRERNPAVQLIGVQPDSPQHGIAGLKYLRVDDVPAIYDPAGVDRIMEISTEEAQEMARRLAREEGLFVGISAGAAVAAAIQVARELDEGVIVALLPDGGFKYTSASFWEG